MRPVSALMTDTCPTIGCETYRKLPSWLSKMVCGSPTTAMVFVIFACPTSITLIPEDFPDTYARFGAPPSACVGGASVRQGSASTKRRSRDQYHLAETDRMTDAPFHRNTNQAAST